MDPVYNYRYCEKCGDVKVYFDYEVCEICGHELKLPPEEYNVSREFYREHHISEFKENIERLREELVKTSPYYDPYIYEHREEVKLARKGPPTEFHFNRDGSCYIVGGPNDPNGKPKCPTCGSINISKISATSKAAGAVFFGLFSTTARSQFQCKNCGYKW